MNAFVEDIIAKKTHCVFLSPHFDDVVLSCGGLLEQLSGKTPITIVNIFTSAHQRPYTLSAKQYLNGSGIADAVAFAKEREKEDAKVLATFDVHAVNIGLEDALFRRKKRQTFLGNLIPEVDHVYPTYRWHITKKIAETDFAIRELKNKLQPFIKKNIVVFAPYGIGNHVDHRITRTVAEKLFDRVVLYSDFPYNVRLGDYGHSLGGPIYTLKPDMRKKTDLVKLYTTQFEGLFPDRKIPDHTEQFFLKNKGKDEKR